MLRSLAMREIERRPTPHVIRGRDGRTPSIVVVHSNEGSAAGTIDWFSRDASGVSAHYLVPLDGTVVQFVDEADGARHAGRVRGPSVPLPDGDPNLYSIGIEFEDGGDPNGVERTEAQYEAGAELLAEIAARWAIPLNRRHVLGHRELFAEKQCPGNLDVDRLVRAAARRG
jgi:N-acetyl-anhydromuramyl-L-alanine amidase AmpD